MGRTVLAAILAAGLVPLLLIVAIVTQDAHGQGTDTASANPVIIPGFVIPNGLHLSFDHVLSIYEWSGKFLDKRSAVPGVAGSADDTVELDAGSDSSKIIELPPLPHPPFSTPMIHSGAVPLRRSLAFSEILMLPAGFRGRKQPTSSLVKLMASALPACVIDRRRRI